MKGINIPQRLLLFILLVFMLGSCRKDFTTPVFPYSVRMTVAQGPYNSVNIDLQGVEITGIEGKTVMLKVNSGIYNLHSFSYGNDTLIASGILNTATVEQIKVILGSNNSVVVHNVSYPLSVQSADLTGLILQVHQTLQDGVPNSILLNFDAEMSVVLDGDGYYKLKPVIRTIEAAITGAIKGKITPVGTFATVTATSAEIVNVTYSSVVTNTGDFTLMGLNSGTYEVTITPLLPLIPVFKRNITVATGVTTYIGTISL